MTFNTFCFQVHTVSTERVCVIMETRHLAWCTSLHLTSDKVCVLLVPEVLETLSQKKGNAAYC